MAPSDAVVFRELAVMSWLWVVLVAASLAAARAATNTSVPMGSFSSTDGNYQASWMVDGSNVIFTMSAATTGWVGIGWSPNPRGHLNTNSIIAWFNNDGTITMIDSYSLNMRETPTPNNFIDSVRSYGLIVPWTFFTDCFGSGRHFGETGWRYNVYHLPTPPCLC